MQWNLLGAGAMGSLTCGYLQQAGFTVTALSRQPTANAPPLKRQLQFSHNREELLSIPQRCCADKATAPISCLLLATKAGNAAAAISAWLPFLAADVTVVCLQNGLGQLDQVALPQASRVIYALTQSGANREQNRVRVVAENPTYMGDGSAQAPHWFAGLAAAWPMLEWREDIALVQHQKLAINAVINPLTAYYRCRNGELLSADRLPQMRALADEVDAILSAIDSHWENDTFECAQRVAQLTAENTSSMLADVAAGRATEIEFINGWLLAEAKKRGIDAPLNQQFLTSLSR